MTRPLLNPRRMILVAALLLTVASLLPARAVHWVAARPSALLRDLMAPVTDPLHTLGAKLRRPADASLEVGSPETLPERYAEAQVYISQLEQRLAGLEEENRRLKQVNQVLNLEGFKRLSASVVAGPDNLSNPQLTINRGRRDGLRQGQVVVDGYNLVGRVSEVGTLTSTVSLIIAPLTHLDVHIRPAEQPRSPHQVLAQLKVEKPGQPFVARAHVEDPVQAGHWAHLADAHWPTEARGFVVGQVTAVEEDLPTPLLRRRVVVEPMRSLLHLTRVIVLVPTEAPAS